MMNLSAYYSLSALCNVLANVVLGVLVFGKNPYSRRNITFSLFCASVAFWSMFYLLWQRTTDSDIALTYCRWLMFGAIWIPSFFFDYTIALLDKADRKRILIWPSYAMSFLLGILDLSTPLVVHHVEPRLGFRFWPVPGYLFHVHLFMFGFLVAYAAFLLFMGIQKEQGLARMQLRYSLIATLVGFGGGVINYLLWYNIPVKPVTNVAVSFYSVIIAYTILKHRLMDISVIVRKTLIYSAVVGTLTTLYLGVITVIAHVFEGLTGYQTAFSSAAAAALVTFCFHPLRKRVQVFIDGKFFRQYVDREEKLYELSREVITHTTPEAMAQALMKVLRETLHPKVGVLYLKSNQGSGFMPTAAWGDNSQEPLSDDSPLARYFVDHPQPFVQDMPSNMGQSQSTRRKTGREEAI